MKRSQRGEGCATGLLNDVLSHHLTPLLLLHDLILRIAAIWIFRPLLDSIRNQNRRFLRKLVCFLLLRPFPTRTVRAIGLDMIFVARI